MITATLYDAMGGSEPMTVIQMPEYHELPRIVVWNRRVFQKDCAIGVANYYEIFAYWSP